MPNKLLYALDKFIPVYGRDRVLVARSGDGKNWERSAVPAVNIGHDYKFDMAYWPFVWKDGDKWKMVFSGSPNLRQPKRIFSLYTSFSNDLINWSDPKDLIVDGGYYMCPRIYFRNEEPQLLWSSGDIGKEIRTCSFNAVSVPGSLVSVYNGDNAVDCVDFNIYDEIMVGVTSKEKGHFLFAKEEAENKWSVFAETCVDMQGYGFINNPTLVKFQNEWQVYYRASRRTAWGSELWCIKSTDFENWSAPQLALDYSGWGKKFIDGKSLGLLGRMSNYELGGVGYPSVVESRGKLFVFYGGYWGLHLLMPYTYWCWR